MRTTSEPRDKARRRKIHPFRALLPWLAVALLLIVGVAIWDAKNYPLPKALDPPVDSMSGDGNLAQQWVSDLREEKYNRFWRNLKLEGTTWKTTHWENGITATVRFTKTHVYVDPPEIKIGIPFVNDTKWEMTDPQMLEAVSPVRDRDGNVIAKRRTSTFEGVEPDGTLQLQTTADDDFKMERIR